MGRRVSWLEILSTIFSLTAAVASLGALYYSAKQVSIARDALQSNERNQAFVGYMTAVGEFCNALDFSEGKNEFQWSTFRDGPRVKVFATYRFNSLVNQTDAARLLGESRRKYRAIQDSGITLQVWLEDGDYNVLIRSLDGLRRIFLRELLSPTTSGSDPQKYFLVASQCYGVREALIGWYKQRDISLSERITTPEDVTVTVRPGSL